MRLSHESRDEEAAVRARGHRLLDPPPVRSDPRVRNARGIPYPAPRPCLPVRPGAELPPWNEPDRHETHDCVRRGGHEKG